MSCYASEIGIIIGMPETGQEKMLLKRWYASAIRSRLELIKKVALTLKLHLLNLFWLSNH